MIAAHSCTVPTAGALRHGLFLDLPMNRLRMHRCSCLIRARHQALSRDSVAILLLLVATTNEGGKALRCFNDDHRVIFSLLFVATS